MFNIPVLEVAMGLVFIYLLFSLLVSGINEAVLGQLVHLRSEILEDSLQALLSDNGRRSSSVRNFGRMVWKMISALFSFFRKKPAPPVPPAPGTPVKFADTILNHPLVKSLALCGLKCPHYLPAGTFSSAVVGTLLSGTAGADIVRLQNGINLLPDPHAKQLLSSLMEGVKDLDDARARLEKWFNDSMDRVTGAYKREIQFWLYIWATIIVVCLNLDTIDLTRRLMTDSEFRTAIVNSASAYVNTTTNTPSSGRHANEVPGVTLAEVQTNINNLQLPLGWAYTNSSLATNKWTAYIPVLRTQISTNGTPGMLVGGLLSGAGTCPTTSQGWWLKVLGLIITIVAISQGAPFWFDILNKVTNIRAGGSPPKVDSSGGGS